jgi:hypothetical protein
MRRQRLAEDPIRPLRHRPPRPHPARGGAWTRPLLPLDRIRLRCALAPAENP